MSARIPTTVGAAVIFLFYFFPPVVLAAISISFSHAPSTIDELQEFEVDVNLVCTGCTSDSYIRGVLYPSGTSYFGYTKNNDGTWINAPGGSCTQYYKIAPSDLVEGSWSGKLAIKPDVSSPFYNSPGDYVFKVGRYTTSCSTTWSTETTITITGPSPTPTSVPTITPAPTLMSTITPTSIPTITKTPTIVPTKNPTNTLTPIQTTHIILDNISPAPTSEILGVEEQRSQPVGNKPYIIALIFASIGFVLLAVVLIAKQIKRI